MTNKTQDSLHEAGSAYRQAVTAYAEIERRFDNAESTLSALSRQALAAEFRTAEAFYQMAVESQVVWALKKSIADYDTARDAAVQERNRAGDALDSVAFEDAATEELSSSVHHDKELEQRAKWFAQRQAALDELQKGEAKCQRRRDVILR